MALEILIPKLGLTMTEGVIEEWVATPGALIKVGDILMRLGTDKVDVDIEAEGEGIFHPNAAAGATLPPGAVAGWLLADGEAAPAAPAPSSAPSEPAAVAAAASGSPAAAAPLAAEAVPAAAVNGGRLKSSPNARRVAAELGLDLTGVRGTGPGGRIVSEDVEEAAAAARTAAPVAVLTAAPAAAAAPGYASPLLRKLAKEQGLDLATVAPSGPNGRIRRDDVQGAVAKRAAAPVKVGPQPGDVIPLTGVRGAIARNMHASLQTMAQLTLGTETDVSALVKVRAQLKDEYASLGLRAPTITDFVVKAAALALRQHPVMNASVTDDAVVLAERVNIGLAVSLDAGLVVPVLNDADVRGIADLSAEAASLAETARAGKLSLPQIEGATFAVSSLGTAGIDFFTPVISPGNVGILGVGRIKDGVRWDGDTPRRTDVLTLSITFDHRAVDGAPAAEFLATVSALLGRPLVLLAG